VTTSSRHWFVAGEGLGVAEGEAEVVIAGGAAGCGTLWNTWIGSASKNSCATMKGEFSAADEVSALFPSHSKIHTLWYHLQVFTPHHFHPIEIFASALPTDVRRSQGSVAAEKVFLLVPERRTSFY
jgi:hypothetical protein